MRLARVCPRANPAVCSRTARANSSTLHLGSRTSASRTCSETLGLSRQGHWAICSITTCTFADAKSRQGRRGISHAGGDRSRRRGDCKIVRCAARSGHLRAHIAACTRSHHRDDCDAPPGVAPPAVGAHRQSSGPSAPCGTVHRYRPYARAQNRAHGRARPVGPREYRGGCPGDLGWAAQNVKTPGALSPLAQEGPHGA